MALSPLFLCEYGAEPSVAKPSAPSSLVATPNADTTVGLAWSLGSGQTSQQIQRSADGGSTWQLVLTVSSTATTATDSTSAGNTNYEYRVKGVNAGGSSTFAASSSILTYPAAPTELDATAVSASEIDLTWLGSAATFTLYGHDSSTTTFSSITTQSGMSYADTGLLASTLYTFEVYGNNTTGTGAASAPASATTEAGAGPATPTGLNPQTAAAPSGDSTIQVFWNSSSGATDYTVQYSTDDASWTQAAQVDSSPQTIGDLTNNTLYYFQVQASNGAGSSAWSSSTTATTLADEIQQIQYVTGSNVPITPTVGSYTLAFGGDTTDSIPFGTVAVGIGAVLNELASINGDAGVTGTSPTFACQFIGALGGASQSLLTVPSNTLVAADNTISVTTTTPASSPACTLSVSEITAGAPTVQNSWVFNVADPSDGAYYDLTIDGIESGFEGGDFPDSAGMPGGNATAFAAMITAICGAPCTAVDANGNSDGGQLPATVTFGDSQEHSCVVDDVSGTSASFTEQTPYAPAVPEVMQITCTPAPNIGQYNIGTDLLNFDDSTGAGVVACQTAINDLLGSGIATVSGGPLSSGAFTVTWNSPGVPPLKLSDATSNFGTPNVVNSTMQTDVNQVDQIQLDPNVSGGTATLGADTFAWNDTGSGVQTAYSDWATANSYSAATIVQTTSSPNTFSITYATAGDQTAVTAALLAALNTSNALTQDVTVSVTETQAGG